ncbi:MAG: heme exporter protein CcmB [Candidatus Kapabacteria bacterium]|nr:heme exporter protein CcmB [Candidatus Kapabacteria bacterium]
MYSPLPWIAVVVKDIRSETRTRYGLTAIGLFVVTAVVLVAFASADEPMPRPIAAGVLWVVMFFTSMTGLARGFVSEEERGTALYLRLSVRPTSVFLGKLLGNIIIAVASNVAVVALFVALMTSVNVGSPWILMLVTLVGSIGMAVVVTITSAIVAKAGTRNALLPILSFPVLLPLVMPGIGATLIAMAGLGIGDVLPDLTLMLCHSGIIIIVSLIVFEVIWCD